MYRTFINIIMAVMALAMSVLTAAQTKGGREVPLRFGDMEHWVTRNISESAVIGGQDKTLYEIGPDKTIDGNVAYRNLGGSPWGTSNVLAKVAGVVKTNCTVTPDTHKGGKCAKLTTHIESLKVLGLVNINVLAAGSIFLGDISDPSPAPRMESGVSTGAYRSSSGLRHCAMTTA